MTIVDLAKNLFSNMEPYVADESMSCHGRKNGHLWVLTLGEAHTPSTALEGVMGNGSYRLAGWLMGVVQVALVRGLVEVGNHGGFRVVE